MQSILHPFSDFSTSTPYLYSAILHFQYFNEDSKDNLFHHDYEHKHRAYKFFDVVCNHTMYQSSNPIVIISQK